jgi:hypothetical protein
MPAAKECADLGPGMQCQMQVPGSLDCGITCMTVVNDSRALGTTHNAWLAAGCVPPKLCPQIRCVALQFGICTPDANKMQHHCSDIAP